MFFIISHAPNSFNYWQSSSAVLALPAVSVFLCWRSIFHRLLLFSSIVNFSSDLCRLTSLTSFPLVPKPASFVCPYFLPSVCFAVFSSDIQSSSWSLPSAPRPMCLCFSGWNCGGGQPGPCRWPTLLPWWCSAVTRCPLAAVTIGDRQVGRVLPWTPNFQHR